MSITFSGSDQETLIFEKHNKTLEFTVFEDGAMLIEAEDDNDRHSVTTSMDFESAVRLQNWLTDQLQRSDKNKEK